MRFRTRLIALALLCLALPRVASAESPEDRALWEKVEKAMLSIQQITYTLVKQERMWPEKELNPAETFQVKFRKPYDIYLDVTAGANKGRHILWRAGWPSLKVHVFGKLMQWMVPNISPISERALAGNHHPITEAGFDNTVGIIKKNLLRNQQLRKQDPSHPAIQIDPMKEVVEEGIPSYYYRSESPEIYKTYTVTENDHDIFDIARKVDNQAYTLMYYNAHKIKKYDDLTVGQELRVPVYYGKTSEFWIDRKTFLIWRIRITDFNGKVYEEYKHLNIKVGAEAGLTDADFDPKNPEYGF